LGQAKRGPAAVKFFVYTFLGSVLMLGSILYLHSLTGTFDYLEIMNGLGSGRIILSSSSQQTSSVSRLLCRFRGEGANFPAAHLASRHLHPGARARNVSARRCDVEDGRLRPDALCDHAGA
jgi:hypothetical protein